jgi:hypothetical protein
LDGHRKLKRITLFGTKADGKLVKKALLKAMI